MCGMYYIDDGTAEEIRKVVKEVCDEIESGIDIRPSQKATVLTRRQNILVSENMKWGFPQYQGNGLLINARAETALEKDLRYAHRELLI